MHDIQSLWFTALLYRRSMSLLPFGIIFNLPLIPGARPCPPFRGQIRTFCRARASGYLLRCDPSIIIYY